MVSGTISPSHRSFFTFPSRYWFTIGLTGVFSLTGWSRQIRAEFLVFRVTQGSTTVRQASHTGLSPSGMTFQTFRSPDFVRYRGPTTPWMRCHNHGLGSSRSLATTGESLFIFSCRVLRCFSSLSVRFLKFMKMTVLQTAGCPIRIRGSRSFAPTRSLSQLITSFIASVSLGIHHTPFFAFSFASSFIHGRYFHTFSCTSRLYPV